MCHGRRRIAALALSGGAALAQAKPTLKISFVDGWSDSVATTNLAAAIMRSKLNVNVELVPLAAGIMWQGVARGDIDMTLSAWLPVTHEAYLTSFKDKVQIVGTNYPGAKIGLIVPDYVKATSLADLNNFRAGLLATTTSQMDHAMSHSKTKKKNLALSHVITQRGFV